MVRTNQITASFKVSAGDGAEAVSASKSNASFTSGDSAVINGTAPNTTAQTWTVADFLGAGVAANGVYFENRDSAIAITLECQVSSSAKILLSVPAGGVFCARFDDNVDVIKVTAASSTADYTLVFAE